MSSNRLSFTARLALGLAPVLILGACTPSSSSDSDSSDGSTGVTVQFSSSAAQITEDTTTVLTFLELSEPADEEITVNYFTSGNATEFADYHLTDPPPITLGAGDVNAEVRIGIFEDFFGELDEVLTLQLVKPSNAGLGVRQTFEVTILDEDATFFPETEPNDDHLEANVVGDIEPLTSYEISGGVVPFTFDVFQLDAVATTNVHLFLDPTSAVSEIILNILDATGNVLFTYDDDQPGTTISAIFTASSGQTFFLAVTVEGAGTDYVLRAVGVAP